jgi:hypothetical protein
VSAPKPPKTLEKRVLKPSERYPNLPVEEVILDFPEAPDCGSCVKRRYTPNLQTLLNDE